MSFLCLHYCCEVSKPSREGFITCCVTHCFLKVSQGVALWRMVTHIPQIHHKQHMWKKPICHQKCSTEIFFSLAPPTSPACNCFSRLLLFWSPQNVTRQYANNLHDSCTWLGLSFIQCHSAPSNRPSPPQADIRPSALSSGCIQYPSTIHAESFIRFFTHSPARGNQTRKILCP